jgi:hypothetical protein
MCLIVLIVPLFVVSGKKVEGQEIKPLTKSEATEFQKKSFVTDSYDKFKQEISMSVSLRNPKSLGREVGSEQKKRAYALRVGISGVSEDEDPTEKDIWFLALIGIAKPDYTIGRNNADKFRFIATNRNGSYKDKKRYSFSIPSLNYQTEMETSGLSVFVMELFQTGPVISSDKLYELFDSDVVEYQVGDWEKKMSNKEKRRILKLLRYAKYVGENGLPSKK